ncbi:MAG: hypothetical protein IJZ74_12615 [Clostridia bacterium]|nr:hypothetical protein [Clostridia bacterium]
MERVYEALTTLRAPLQQGEYDLHRLVMDALNTAGIPWEHEVKLAPRCRIDLMCGSVGVEIKRGKVEKTRILEQLRRYAACQQVKSLILVTEKTVPVPHTILGKPVRLICLNRLWGIAL